MAEKKSSSHSACRCGGEVDGMGWESHLPDGARQHPAMHEARTAQMDQELYNRSIQLKTTQSTDQSWNQHQVHSTTHKFSGQRNKLNMKVTMLQDLTTSVQKIMMDSGTNQTPTCPPKNPMALRKGGRCTAEEWKDSRPDKHTVGREWTVTWKQFF